jgi:hypothetical protein
MSESLSDRIADWLIVVIACVVLVAIFMGKLQ